MKIQKHKYLNKYPKEVKDLIIKIQPGANYIGYKEEASLKPKTTKAPEWFTDWTTSFEKKNDERWDKQEKFNNDVNNKLDKIMSLPTIKKELEELNK